MMTFAIFGAAGATGLKTVRQALSRGHRVIAIELEDDPSLAALDGVELRTADVMNDDLGPVLDGLTPSSPALASAARSLLCWIRRRFIQRVRVASSRE